MWIVKVALSRPYTFIVLALLILLISPLVILRTPTDIFPNINIPVVSILYSYSGLGAEEMEQRITSVYERILTTTVNDIEHMESQSLNGTSVVKVFFQPGVQVSAAVAQLTASSQPAIRQMPPGITPPLVISYSASSVPILQLALSGQGLQTAVERFRHQLHSPIPGDCAGCLGAVALRREAKADHDRSAPGGDAGAGPVAERCCERGERAEPDSPGGHVENRAVRIRRGSERQER